MKKKMFLNILLIITIIVAFTSTIVYAVPDKGYVYMYESTAQIYGASDTNKVDIPIPSGFRYKESETGYITIQDKTNSNLQYIWVPLNDISIKDDLWEQVYQKYEQKDGKKISTNSDLYKKIKNSKETVLKEFAKSIEEYKGFYISEAELSYDRDNKLYNKARGMIDNSVTNTKEKGDYYRGSNIKDFSYDKIKSISENISKDNNAVKSHLLYGVEWDAALLWIANSYPRYIDVKGNDIYKVLVANSTYVGKYNNSKLESTIESKDTEFFNGIWGLGGNLAEITQETYNSKYVIRGGSYNTTGEHAPIASRDATNDLEKEEIGFRTALYVTPGLERKTITSDEQYYEDETENSTNSNKQSGAEKQKDNEIDELEGIEYTDILEEKAGANDANHLETRKSYSKIL